MKRVMTALGLAVAVIGCESRNTANRTNTGVETRSDNDTAQAQNDAQDKMQGAQQDLTQAQQDAQQKMNDAQANADEKKAEAQRDLQDEKAQAQDKMRDAQASAGQAVTVTGTVENLDDDSFTLKTADGKNLELELEDGSGRQSPMTQFGQVKEGDQVRASYIERDGDHIIQDLNVVQPAPDKK